MPLEGERGSKSATTTLLLMGVLFNEFRLGLAVSIGLSATSVIVAKLVRDRLFSLVFLFCLLADTLANSSYCSI